MWCFNMYRDEEPRIKNYNTRDTKKWCRGKVGVEHNASWKILPPWSIASFDRIGYVYTTLVCERCGKQLKYKRVDKKWLSNPH